jgi:hypothetical protein
MRLMEELDTFTRRGSNGSIAAPQRALGTGNWKIKTYGMCFKASSAILVLSGDHVLRSLGFRGCAR